MRRTPIYHKQDDNYRVVFRHPKHWVAQRHTGAQSSRTLDPWQDLHRPVEDHERAIAIMHERKPIII